MSVPFCVKRPLKKLKDWMKKSLHADHNTAHGRINHGFAGLQIEFVVFAQALSSAQPGKRALNYPAAR